MRTAGTGFPKFGASLPFVRSGRREAPFFSCVSRLIKSSSELYSCCHRKAYLDYLSEMELQKVSDFATPKATRQIFRYRGFRLPRPHRAGLTPATSAAANEASRQRRRARFGVSKSSRGCLKPACVFFCVSVKSAKYGLADITDNGFFFTENRRTLRRLLRLFFAALSSFHCYTRLSLPRS